MIRRKNNRHVRTDWIIGWKCANVYADSNLRTLWFMPIHQDGLIDPYGVDATAVCQQYSGHKAPVTACKCGFNAWDDLATVYRYTNQAQRQFSAYQTESLALLRVGLHGRVIEGTAEVGPSLQFWGYRASQQRVADLFFKQVCHATSCTEYPRELALVRQDSVAGWILRPACPRHGSRRHATIAPAVLERRNKVKIHWGYPSE